MSDIQSEGVKAINLDEHNDEAHAKRTILRAQDPDTGDWANIGAVDTGDGSFGIKTGDPNLASRIDDTNDPIIYIGKAPIGSSESNAVWQVVKLDTSSGLIKTWADGDASFDNVWADRASLTYQ